MSSDQSENEEYAAIIAWHMKESADARKALHKEKIVWVSQLPAPTLGDYFSNYAGMLKNRMLDLYDDTLLLLNAGRVPSACIVARCIIETYAIGPYICARVDDAVKEGGAKAAFDEVLRFINSSRIKVDEQKRLKQGVFELTNYEFTEEAKLRMMAESAASVHVMAALKNLFEMEKKSKGWKESSIELDYAGLCEWTHPSQTSLFHAYTTQLPPTPTSKGPLPKLQFAKLSCSKAMHFITGVAGWYDHLLLSATELNKLKIEQ